MNADSVKARLKNFAVSSGCTFQEALVYYGLERTIYRLSIFQPIYFRNVLVDRRSPHGMRKRFR